MDVQRGGIPPPPVPLLLAALTTFVLTADFALASPPRHHPATRKVRHQGMEMEHSVQQYPPPRKKAERILPSAEEHKTGVATISVPNTPPIREYGFPFLLQSRDFEEALLLQRGQVRLLHPRRRFLLCWGL